MKRNTPAIILSVLLMIVSLHVVSAQPAGCVFKDPFFKVNFGDAGMPRAAVNPFASVRYSEVQDNCPNDGNYSFVSSTRDCFNGDWLTFNQDHTRGDNDGKMMLVNASPEGGVFLQMTIPNVRPNTTYELGAWMTNVCRISGGCPPLPPNITINIFTPSGKKIVSFHTGLLVQHTSPAWKKYNGIFTTPENVSQLIVTMEDVTTGGCGNDFALDDITLSECIIPKPALVTKTALPVKSPKIKAPEAIKTVTKNLPESKPEIKKMPVNTSPVKDTIAKPKVIVAAGNPLPQIKPKPIATPAVITTRANPLIKQIETEPGEIVMQLYDNGDIDGDTVSVYHNNRLIVSRAGLSATPVTFHIKVSAGEPYHEIIMVANNLGSIPPNTSVMVIKANDKRYEVFISSSEQTNAKIVIKLKG